jgi:SAM-dependent methyltransferase
MDHADHVHLLQGGVPGPGGVWADFGSGSGAFTLALADLLGPSATIYSIDKDQRALRRQESRMNARFPQITIHYVAADYTRALELPALDGAVMANALHFQRAKDHVLRLIRGYLRPGGSFVIVEYNVERGNRWVPYPLSSNTWERLARRNGFTEPRVLSKRPSRFLGEIYSAAAVRPHSPDSGLAADDR